MVLQNAEPQLVDVGTLDYLKLDIALGVSCGPLHAGLLVLDHESAVLVEGIGIALESVVFVGQMRDERALLPALHDPRTRNRFAPQRIMSEKLLHRVGRLEGLIDYWAPVGFGQDVGLQKAVLPLCKPGQLREEELDRVVVHLLHAIQNIWVNIAGPVAAQLVGVERQRRHVAERNVVSGDGLAIAPLEIPAHANYGGIERLVAYLLFLDGCRHAQRRRWAEHEVGRSIAVKADVGLLVTNECVPDRCIRAQLCPDVQCGGVLENRHLIHFLRRLPHRAHTRDDGHEQQHSQTKPEVSHYPHVPPFVI